MAIDFDDPKVRGVFFELYNPLPRGGPGSDASTLRALELVGELPPAPRVLDLGCGPGMQTRTLAKALPEARLVALDFHQPFLDALVERAAEAGVGDRIETLCGDMGELPFEPASFDLLWSEGAAYSIGLEVALAKWRPLLRPGGCLALTEATWLRPDPPERVRRMWDEYPAMRDRQGCVELFESLGYRVVADFVLPESDWLVEYYAPIEARLPLLEQKYAGDDVALAVLAESREEIAVYRSGSAWYGYTFFVLRA